MAVKWPYYFRAPTTAHIHHCTLVIKFSNVKKGLTANRNSDCWEVTFYHVTGTGVTASLRLNVVQNLSQIVSQ